MRHKSGKAIWLGGDSDTLACITGGIAEAYYRKMPEDWTEKSVNLLDDALKETLILFQDKFQKFKS